MLTKFTTIVHVITGLTFVESAKKCYGILSRHFENGFVTELASTSVLSLGAFVFSMAILFAGWGMVDAAYGWSTIPATDAEGFVVGMFYMWIIFNSLAVYSPVPGMAFILFIAYILDVYDVPGQEYYISPLAAGFVGCTATLFLRWMAGIILDTIDVCFVCYAIDKDNEVDKSEDVFALLISDLPGLKSNQAGPTAVPMGTPGLLVIDPSTGMPVQNASAPYAVAPPVQMVEMGVVSPTGGMPLAPGAMAPVEPAGYTLGTASVMPTQQPEK